MSIEFKPGRYFIGVWFIGDGRACWMGAVYQDEEDKAESMWHIRYRFRYYAAKDAWDGKDEKNWYGGDAKRTEAEVEKTVHGLWDVMTRSWPHFHGGRRAKAEFCSMRSADPRENMERLQAKDWTHMRIKEVP